MQQQHLELWLAHPTNHSNCDWFTKRTCQTATGLRNDSNYDWFRHRTYVNSTELVSKQLTLNLTQASARSLSLSALARVTLYLESFKLARLQSLRLVLKKNLSETHARTTRTSNLFVLKSEFWIHFEKTRLLTWPNYQLTHYHGQ